jgi:hypothetical protein
MLKPSGFESIIIDWRTGSQTNDETTRVGKKLSLSHAKSVARTKIAMTEEVQ